MGSPSPLGYAVQCRPRTAGPLVPRRDGITERSPRTREFLAWTYVVLWSGLIFLSVPFVRAGVEFVREHWGRETFTYVVIAGVILALAAALVVTLKQPRRSLASYAWLLGCAGLVAYLAYDLKNSSPEEAIHYLQYGVLSVLLYFAFAHRIRDYGIYAAATIVGTFVGMLDETLQWLTPRRVFSTSDVWLNFTAVALVQLAIAVGVRPAVISGWPDALGLRRLCRLAAVAVTYLGLCYLNTPDRVGWYSERVPLLGFIDHEQRIMTEYGYLHGDLSTALFRSRLTVEELRRLSRERAEEGAGILDAHRELKRYFDFLKAYTPVSDPFLHEARVHLFRRDIHVERAQDDEDIEKRADQYAVAHWENYILETYFGDLLAASSYVWPAELKAEVEANMDVDKRYESRVSIQLITSHSQREVIWVFLSAVVGLLLLSAYFGWRARRVRNQ